MLGGIGVTWRDARNDVFSDLHGFRLIAGQCTSQIYMIDFTTLAYTLWSESVADFDGSPTQHTETNFSRVAVLPLSLLSNLAAWQLSYLANLTHVATCST